MKKKRTKKKSVKKLMTISQAKRLATIAFNAGKAAGWSIGYKANYRSGKQ